MFKDHIKTLPSDQRQEWTEIYNKFEATLAERDANLGINLNREDDID